MPEPRELTDDYRLEKILGSSRGASILRAGALATGEPVVVKLIHLPPQASASRAASLAARFLDYAATLSRLRHPNLPAVLDFGMTPDGGVFLVMEPLAGVDFEAYVPAEGSSPDLVLPLLAQALDGLEELARHGLAHLNVTPDNLFVVLAGAGEPPSALIKLVGLGTPLFHLGEPRSEAESARFRAPELALPVPALAAPPNLAALAPFVDWHADCYSLALTACHALGATVAFGEASGAIVQMPLALSFELANDEALRQILERCLRRLPAQRPPHAVIREAFSLALGGLDLPRGVLPLSETPPAPGAAAWSGAASPAAGATLPPFSAPLAVPSRSTTLAELLDPEPSLFGATLPEAPSAAPHADHAAHPSAPDLPHVPQGAQTPQPPAPAGDAAAGTHGTHAMDTAYEALPGRQAGGNDSLLDLFEVPDTLPDLPDLEEDSPGGGHLQEEALPADHLAASPALSATEMAAALGLHLPGGEDAREEPRFAGLHPGAADEAPRLDGAEGWPAPPAPPSWAEPAAPQAPAARPRSLPTGGSPPAAAHAAAEPRFAAPAPRAATAGAPAPPTSAGSPRLAPPPAAAAAAGAPAAHAAASAAGPRPPAPQGDSPPGEMLSAVDDLLSSLPPPLPLPAAPAPARAVKGGGAAPPPAGAPVRSAVAAGAKGRALAALRGIPRPALLAAAGALALVLAAAVWLLAGRGPRRASAAPPPAAAPASSPMIPAKPPAAKLADAESLLILGRESDQRVRRALRELSFGEQGALGEAGCGRLGAIEQTLALTALESVQQDLASGLRTGDLGVLETLVGVASERDVPPNQKSDLARARGLVDLYERAQAASSRGDQAEVLDRWRAMEGLSRSLRDPLELRDKAAQALEAEAAALAHDGNYAEASSRLDPIRRTWPERAGIKELVKGYETAAANESRQQAILDSVPNILRRRKPSEGLDLLRPLAPTPHLEARVREAIRQLEDQLAQVDAQPPQVVLRDGYLLEYSRGQVINLSFRVTDDYQVKSVKMYARAESGGMREIPLQRAGLGYSVQLPPSFHQNGTVEFYVVASDLSGHEGYLGSKEQPKRIHRRQGFERLLR